MLVRVNYLQGGMSRVKAAWEDFCVAPRNAVSLSRAGVPNFYLKFKLEYAVYFTSRYEFLFPCETCTPLLRREFLYLSPKTRTPQFNLILPSIEAHGLKQNSTLFQSYAHLR